MPASNHTHHILDKDVPIFRPKPGIFSDRQLSEIFYSLEKCEIPRKYGYFDKGVERWAKKSFNNKVEMVTSTSKMNLTHYSLLNDSLEMVLTAIQGTGEINLVDMGCGTGFPAYPVIYFLQEKKRFGKYIAMDIVPEMVDLALTNLRKEGIINDKNSLGCVHDFEDGHFADFLIKHRNKSTVNLFCFFSSTLGTMVDRHRALANFRDSMTEGDLLWIGNALKPNTKHLLDYFQSLEINSDQYMWSHGAPLSFFECFDNMKWQDFGYVQVEEIEEGFLKYYFNVEKPFILDIPNVANKKTDIRFSVKDKITFCQFKNYSEADLLNEVKEAGFKIKMMTVSDDYRAGLVLVSV